MRLCFRNSCIACKIINLRQIARYLPHHRSGNASKTHPKSSHDKFKTASYKQGSYVLLFILDSEQPTEEADKDVAFLRLLFRCLLTGRNLFQRVFRCDGVGR